MGKGARVEVLEGIDVTLAAGELCALLGPSGSGKSTFLNLVGGLERPDAGTIEVDGTMDGTSLETLSDHDLGEYRRSTLGFVFQFYNLVEDLTIRENIEVCRCISKDPLEVDGLLRSLGLWEQRDKFLAQVSGGQQQRCSIGRALVKKPRLLLCDEPTGALDYETSKEILELIEQVSHDYGCTTIIVTHNAAIGQMAERRLRLREGALVENELNPSPIPAAELEWQGAGMRNPLHRRFERQLVHEAGKHLGIFVLLIVTIGVVSEFLATSASMQKTYADLDGTDALEDARFETAEATTDEARSAVEDLGVKVYDNPSRDAEVTQDGLEATVRVYVSQDHADIDRPSLFEGRLPEADDEIALDDACCANHGLEVATPSSSRARR